jgi:hypothetical protein
MLEGGNFHNGIEVPSSINDTDSIENHDRCRERLQNKVSSFGIVTSVFFFMVVGKTGKTFNV